MHKINNLPHSRLGYHRPNQLQSEVSLHWTLTGEYLGPPEGDLLQVEEYRNAQSVVGGMGVPA